MKLAIPTVRLPDRRLLDLRRILAATGLDPEATVAYWLLSLFFRLPPQKELLDRLALLFPHIDVRRLHAADLIRLPMQLLWLLFVRPSRRQFPAPPGWFTQGLRSSTRMLARAVDHHWAMRQSTPATDDDGLAPMLGRLVGQSPRRRQLAWLAGGGFIALAATVPLDPSGQAGLAVLLLLLLLLTAPGTDTLRTLARCLSIALSLRYFWWRATGTLDDNQQLALTLALGLLLAEIRLWAGVVLPVRNSQIIAALATAWLAQWGMLLAPAIVLVFGLPLIQADLLMFALYGLPHLLAIVLLQGMHKPSHLHVVQRARDVHAALFSPKVGAGRTAPGWLAWGNLAAVVAGALLLTRNLEPLTGLVPAYIIWALLNLGYLSIAAALPDRGSVQVAPSLAWRWSVVALPSLLMAVLRLPDFLRHWLRAARTTLTWWLPRSPAPLLVLLVCTVWLDMASSAAFAQGGNSKTFFKSLEQAATADLVRSAARRNPEQLMRRLSLKELSGFNNLPLRTTDGTASVYFGQRADELVISVRLRLRYTHSPALLPNDSHIKIMLNDEMVGVAPIRKESEGRAIVQEFEIDPRFIIDRNELRFRFIGHYTLTCEDPMRNSLWADISGSSELIVSYAPLVLKDDLSRLPEPFFDKRDLRTLTLPVVVPAKGALPTLNAAGIVTSWFGQFAGNRGAQFPTQLDTLQAGHGIVFATNADRPAFLRGRPLVDGPTIEMITNPMDGVSKLLVLQGRDGIDLTEAAQALVSGYTAMSGTKVVIRSRRDDAPRQAYDAPNWLRSDRPTRLGELIAYPQQLQASGHQPPPLKLELRAPPDLFAVGRRDVPMSLRYRYSPPTRAGDNLLTMSMNKTLVQSWSLAPKPAGSGVQRLFAGDNTLAADERQLHLPASRIKGRNRVDFAFAFARYQEGPCPDVPPDDSRRALVDPESTIDLSGFHHFTRMPNLNHFATVGFPFTKYADLSQTVVVMPEKPAREEIETLLNLLGQFGRATGIPASKVRVVGPVEESLLQDADLLVIGSAMGQGALARWPDYVPADIAGNLRRISQPARGMNFLYDWLGFGVDADQTIMSQDKFSADGPLALIVGFRSPLSMTRSVVAITATAPDHLWQATNAINDELLAADVNGSVAFIRGTQVSSFRVGESYYVGELPWWVTIWFPLSLRPILLSLLTLAAIVLLAMAWTWQRRWRAAHPIDEDEDA